MMKLSPDEMAYHTKVIVNLQAAQGAFNIWADHLRQKYSLKAEDTIDVSGVIHKVEPWADPLDTVQTYDHP